LDRTLLNLPNIPGGFCHPVFAKSFLQARAGSGFRVTFALALAGLAAGHVSAQLRPFPNPPRPQSAAPPPAPAKPAPARTTALPRNEIELRALSQETDGPWRRLRGMARIETSEVLFQADQIDYNEETRYAEARGNVYFQRFAGGEEIRADRVEYDGAGDTARYYNVRGSVPARIDPRPGVLASGNPFSFQGRWVERLKNRYILHDGLITNCKLPLPTWTLTGPRFEIVPHDHAIARNAVFRIRKIPLFYAPFFYKSLADEPRKSGFLTPNIGNSSRRGKMLGVGYYWAMNRSYDAMYRTQYFTERGFAHHLDLRGKPRQRSDFNFILYGVNDRGLKLDSGERRQEGGFLISFDGHSDLGRGFLARGEINYLSSFRFRQAFTESFYEAIFSEVHSLGFVARHWSSCDLNAVFARTETFLSTEPGDHIVIRRLPEVEFRSRDRQLTRRLPLWLSLESAAGLMRRNQPLFQTRQFVERLDFAPRIMSALRWKDIHLIPAFSVRETYWGSSQGEARVEGGNVTRTAREFSLDLVLPSLARTFAAPAWMGERLKHVLEPRASFRDVRGVQDFDRLVRFDETELLTNTRELEVSLINRLFARRKDGQVTEVLSWQLWQRRYFDPTFGGAVVEGRRNVVLSAAELTGYAFLDGPRRYSPVVSALRLSPAPGFGVEWRADYDPLRGGFVNSGITGDARFSNYFLSLGHNQVHSTSLLAPAANQFRGMLGLGKPNQRGWGAAFSAVYDFRKATMQYATTQVTYNTDCCGLSFQYRRFGFGTRNENQFRVAFAIANIGTFGTLKKQERLF
jgi:LPS-assembly protein